MYSHIIQYCYVYKFFSLLIALLESMGMPKHIIFYLYL